MFRNGSLLGAVLVLVMVSACGSGGGKTAPTDQSVALVAPDGAAEATPSAESDGETLLGLESTVPAGEPSEASDVQRILPVDGDLAEIVFALGFGDQVVATDISATYPTEADALPEIGYQRALAPEPIAAMEPTIVLATDLAGPVETLDALDRLGIETVIIERESRPGGPGDKIRAVAAAIGAADLGRRLAADVDEQIAAAIARASTATTAPRVAVLYLRGKNVQLLLGEGSGVDWIIDAAGGIDVADELGVVDNAPINAESLLVAAPDVLIVPQRGLDSVGGIDGLLDVPGVAETRAGRNGRVFAYDDQFLLGNGPRTGELLDQLITDLHGDI